MPNKKKTIFIAGDFVNSQYLWLIPIIDGFAQNTNIKNIIFEKKLSKKILEELYVKKFLEKYNIITLNEKKYLRYFRLIIYTTLNIKNLFLKIFNFDNLLSNRSNLNWHDSQINHGIWDYVNLNINENNLRKKIFYKFLSIILSFEKIYLIKRLNKIYNLKYAFLGHTVYASRSLIASLRKNNTQVFTHASFNIHKQKKLHDVNWGDIDKKTFNYIRKNKAFKKDSKIYWKKRLEGKGSYEDSKIASLSMSAKPLKIKNFIFMHIFRDSPFNTIDNKRIFNDYFDWINCTLDIINNSDENWEFRFHPSHKRWGENQKKIFINLLDKKKNFNNKNIYFNYSKKSNNEIFKCANKIITFSGTSQYESVANGLKPIVISNSPLNKINNNIIFKPISLSQYKNLILTKDLNKFKHTEKMMSFAKDIIFFREKFLRIKDMIGGNDTYRGDPIIRLNEDYFNTKQGVISNYQYLYDSGKNLLKTKTIYSNIIKKYKE